MKINEIITESQELDEVNLKSLAAAGAMSLALAGNSQAGQTNDYYADYNRMTDVEHRQVWDNRTDNLKKNVNQTYKEIYNLLPREYKQRLEGSQLIVLPVPAGGPFASAWSSKHKKQISIDVSLFWDAPKSTLAFILAHEIGHIVHDDGLHPINMTPMQAMQNRDKEMNADVFATQIMKKLGYNKADVFQFLKLQSDQNEYYQRLLNFIKGGSHPTSQQRIDKAKEQGFQLSQTGKNQVDYYLNHLA